MSSFVKNTSIYQLFANLKAGLKYVIHMGLLVNSGTCETPGMFPLDAAYGKTLTDQITGLYSDLPIYMTQAEYDAMGSGRPDRLYVIIADQGV